jgi:hypothetical protein
MNPTVHYIWQWRTMNGQWIDMAWWHKSEAEAREIGPSWNTENPTRLIERVISEKVLDSPPGKA